MDLLDRLYNRLRVALGAAGAEPDRGVTIADLYQRLIPYRVVRGEAGVMELAEYEHALLRLLAGERLYVEVVDLEVRVEIQRELASLNPILGIYRDYPNAVVRVMAAASAPPAEVVMDTAAEDDRHSDLREPGRQPALAEAPRAPPPAFETRRVAPRPPPRDLPKLSESAASREPMDFPPSPPPADCTSCHRALPSVTAVRFCPFCGSEQPNPCVKCGMLLEEEWSFCIRCGTPRGS